MTICNQAKHKIFISILKVVVILLPNGLIYDVNIKHINTRNHGDLNITIRDYYFRDLIAIAVLQNSIYTYSVDWFPNASISNMNIFIGEFE